jgi:Zn-dependent protease with chaperone function
VDGGLLMVIAFENLSGGMGTAAFVAFLMSLCNQRFTATQFALLSAFASVGRVWVGPLAGVLAESIGWPTLLHHQHRAGGAGAGDAVVAAIAQRIIPFTPECNDRARQWRWEVNLIGSQDVNAFCMPGGKIAFFYGILSKLQLNDDEVATIMGHEAAHALLEHAREQMGKNALTQGGLRLGAALLGLGSLGDMAAQVGTQLLSLKFSRDDESEADALGLVMSARAGYDPRAGVTLWQKMMAASGAKGGPGFLSTHPTNKERIADIEARMARVQPMFETADKPPRRFAPPPQTPPKAAAR